MQDGAPPYRGRNPRPSPYAAAWREYAWRRRGGTLLMVLWFALFVLVAVRRTRMGWAGFVFLFFPQMTAVCLWGFRCPRCQRRFAVSKTSGRWQANAVESCVHCGLPRGAPADPDESALPRASTKPASDS